MAFVVFERGSLRGRRLALPGGGALSVGRGKDCSLKLPDRRVSRVHCVLVHRDGRWWIEDRGSRNGTFLNGRRIESSPLADGDFVQIGDTVFSFLAEAQDPLLGAELSGYYVEARVGRGAVGVVYRALQRSLDRKVALKVLDSRLSADPAFVSRFTKEARSAAKLTHPNVVQIYDARSSQVSPDGGERRIHFIAMEFLPGGSLEDVVLADGPLPQEQVVQIGCQALSGLGFAWERGFMHRHLKPSNLLFSGTGLVKICDLGIAPEPADPKDLVAGKVAGSPAYAAPEEIRGGVVDHRADLYSLGAVLYYALTGVPPFEGDTVKEIIKKKLSSAPPSPRKHIPSISPRLTKVIEKLMAPDPEKRYSCAGEAAEALNSALRGRTRPPVRRHRRVRRVRKTGPQLAVASVAVILAAVLGLAFLKSHRQEERSQQAGSPPQAERASDQKGLSDFAPPAPPAPLRSVPTGPKRPQDLQQESASESLWKAALAEAERALTSGDLRKAAELFNEAERSGAPAERVSALKAALTERIEALLKQEKERVSALCAQGAFREAGKRIAQLRSLLPEGTSGLGEIENQVAEAEAAWNSEARSLRKALREAYLEAAYLRFASALKKLSSYGCKYVPLEKEKQEALSDLKAAQAAWDRLNEVLRRFAGVHKKITLSFGIDPITGKAQKERRYKIYKYADTLVTLRDSENSDRIELRSVFEFPPETLLALLLAAGDPPLKPEEFGSALGLLAFLRAGKTEALALVESGGLPEDVRARRAERAKKFSELHLEVGLSLLRERYRVFSRKGAPGGGFGFLAREAARLARAWKAAGRFDEVRKELEEIFVASRIEEFTREDLSGLFHAAEVKSLRGGVVRLTYDFTSKEQAEDFRFFQVPGTKLEVLPAEGALRLQGEVRFLRDYPFEIYLGVRGKVLECDPDSPNVNIAFWTEPNERISVDLPKLDVRGWLRRLNQQTRPEYLVCGFGYRLRFNLNRFLPRVPGPKGPRFMALPPGAGRRPPVPPGAPVFVGPLYLREPAFVIMGGEHGHDLGWAPGQLLWSGSAAGKIRTPFVFTVELKGGLLRWSVDGRALPFRRTGSLGKLAKTLSKEGSFSLFTNGSVVSFGGLEVQGKLRDQFLRKEAARIAREQWNSISGSRAPEESSAGSQ